MVWRVSIQGSSAYRLGALVQFQLLGQGVVLKDCHFCVNSKIVIKSQRRRLSFRLNNSTPSLNTFLTATLFHDHLSIFAGFPPILNSGSSLYFKQFYTREEEMDIFTVFTSDLNKLTLAWVVSCLFWSTLPRSLLLILYVANLLFTKHTELAVCLIYI